MKKTLIVILFLLPFAVCCCNSANEEIKHPYAIAMWDFSWLERRSDGSGFEDWDAYLNHLKTVEDEESDASFNQTTTCEFKQPYEVEVYTSNLETKEVTIRYHYTQPENIADNQVILLKRKKAREAKSYYINLIVRKLHSARKFKTPTTAYCIKLCPKTQAGFGKEEEHSLLYRKIIYT